ncbi:uncharacterized protein LOC126842386 [Adelges cooleyi]|uniref:uncharacterized protein LOC126842386 n=1 Tax=Adelges cooleyi TaxID=133065 RepID=UPI00217FE9C6|nr:uncharacterized protein LOC126842386 [Adelges cooleyi]
MKLLCILITVATVNVSPIMTSLYSDSVYITNKWIKEAADKQPAGLETAISNLINGGISIDPAGLETAKEAFEIESAGPETAISNITNGDRSIGIFNLMLTIPEKKDYRWIHRDDSFFVDLPEHVAIAYQKAVQEAISKVTNITVPDLAPNEYFVDRYLPRYGNERRAITGKITKKLLIAAIGDGAPHFPNFPKICLLIALLRSMRDPKAYIRTVDVDPSGNSCILTSRNGSFKYQPRRKCKIFIAAVTPKDHIWSRNKFVDVLEEIQLWFL